MTGNALEQNYTVGHDNFLSTMLPAHRDPSPTLVLPAGMSANLASVDVTRRLTLTKFRLTSVSADASNSKACFPRPEAHHLHTFV